MKYWYLQIQWNIEIYNEILKCTIKLKCTMKYWNVQWNIDIYNEIFKCAMKYWSFHYNNEMKAAIIQWCIEICNKTMKYIHQLYNATIQLKIS